MWDFFAKIGNEIKSAAEKVGQCIVDAAKWVGNAAVKLFKKIEEKVTPIVEKVKEFAHVAASYIRENPGTVAFIVGGVVGILSPFIVGPILGAIGFGTGGIAAGSFAAWMMSLGAGITSTLVSIFQSIGALWSLATSTKVLIGFFAGCITYLAIHWCCAERNRATNQYDAENQEIPT